MLDGSCLPVAAFFFGQTQDISDYDIHPSIWAATAIIATVTKCNYLGGGFKYFLFSSIFGEMIQFD